MDFLENLIRMLDDVNNFILEYCFTGTLLDWQVNANIFKVMHNTLLCDFPLIFFVYCTVDYNEM